MMPPKLRPVVQKEFPGFFSKTDLSFKIWLCVAWVGFLILPWYSAYDGFWSFIWITDGYPTFNEYSPGILQIILHQRWWLLPILIALFIPLSALKWERNDPRYSLTLLYAGGIGFTYTISQGFILGLHGWGWERKREVRRCQCQQQQRSIKNLRTLARINHSLSNKILF